jgi:two-component system LytT family response regulator
MDSIDTIIIDDQRKNIELLRFFLTKFCPDINIVGVAHSYKEGVKLIKETNIHLVFLDIELGSGVTGFDLLDTLKMIDIKVIVISAYSKYAMKAIKYNVVDFLLKPLSSEEVIKSVNKVKLRLSDEGYVNNSLEVLAIGTLRDIFFLTVSDIIYLRAEGKYTRIKFDDGSSIISTQNLMEYEDILKHHAFFRVHKTFLINVDKIERVNKKDGFYCKMKNGEVIGVARRKRDAFIQYVFLKKNIRLK